MERFDFSALNNVLGIYRPWSIKSVEADNSKSQLLVNLEANKKKKKFSFFESKKNEDEVLIEGSWQYQQMGSFRSVIQAQTSPLQTDVPISETLLSLPAFVGHPARKYSNFLRQQVALAQLKGLSNAMIASTLFIDEALIEQIIKDINNSPSKSRALVCLPTEIDPVWNKVLTDKIHIRTYVLPLKLLLSKLKLAAVRTEEVDSFEMITQLRDFFLANVHLMDNEIDQICGIDEKIKSRVQQQKSKQRLILPSLRNPLWLNVLTGKLKLNSLSVPLNLLISRQQVVFLNSKTMEEKIEAIDMVRQYFRKHYRSLKAELLLINRAMEVREQSQWRLPDPDHVIWQKILDDKDFVSSDHIAYKLLLAKLRSQVSLSKDPVVKLEAARRIRKFLHENQKSMRNELNTILLQFGKAV